MQSLGALPQVIAQYLASPAGRHTPDDVAVLLLELDPNLVLLRAESITIEDVARYRAWLEDVRGVTPDNDIAASNDGESASKGSRRGVRKCADKEDERVRARNAAAHGFGRFESLPNVR